MPVLEPEEAIDALQRIVREAKVEIAHKIDLGLNRAHRLAITKYMVGGGKRAPVNPPPGPLRKRSGDLARGVYVKFFKWDGDESGHGELTWDDSLIPYGKVHEYGGIRVPVPARPFAAPAVRDIVPGTEKDIQRSFLQVAARLRLL